MANKTISQRIVESSKTGQEAKFYETDSTSSGTEYEFTPDGLKDYIENTFDSTLSIALSQFTVADISTGQTATIPSSVKLCKVQSYDISNYSTGSANYARVISEPTHNMKFRSADRYLPNETISAGNGGWWELSEKIVDPYMAGAIGDGTEDDTVPITDIVGYALVHEGTHIKIPVGTFGMSTDKIFIPSNTTISFDGWIKVLGNPDDGFDTILVPRVGASNVRIVNPQIDLNNIPSMNGFLIRTGNHECTVTGGTIKNGAHDKGGTNGGRGFNIESADTAFSGRNVSISGLSILDCYMGFGIRGGESVNKSNIVINDIRIENCDVGYWLVGNTIGYPHDQDEMQGIISNVTMINCGNNTEYTGQDGAVVADRGCNFRQTNIVVNNDSSYATIDQVIRGNFANCYLQLDFYGSATNLLSFSPYKESDSGPDYESSVETSNFILRGYGSFTDVIKNTAVSAGYVTNTEVIAKCGTITSGRAAPSNYVGMTSLYLDIFEETNSARIVGLADDIGSLTFSTMAGKEARMTTLRTLSIESRGDISSSAFAPTITLYDLSASSKDFRLKADSSQVLLSTDATADSGAFDRPIVTYNDATGIGQLCSGGTEIIGWTGTNVRIKGGTTPSSATDTGVTGEVRWDASYMYVCTATNTWRRIAHATW